jgi:hypothetical protein
MLHGVVVQSVAENAVGENKSLDLLP